MQHSYGMIQQNSSFDPDVVPTCLMAFPRAHRLAHHSCMQILNIREDAVLRSPGPLETFNVHFIVHPTATLKIMVPAANMQRAPADMEKPKVRVCLPSLLLYQRRSNNNICSFPVIVSQRFGIFKVLMVLNRLHTEVMAGAVKACQTSHYDAARQTQSNKSGSTRKQISGAWYIIYYYCPRSPWDRPREPVACRGTSRGISCGFPRELPRDGPVHTSNCSE